MKLLQVVIALLGLFSTAAGLVVAKNTDKTNGLDDNYLAASNTERTIEPGGKSPTYDYDTHVSLINATPYRWHKTYNHSFQMGGWEKRWPEYIEQGQSTTVYAMNEHEWAKDKSAAETTYELEGTSKPTSLQVRYIGKPHSVYVKFLDNLHTMNNAKNTEHSLGFQREPGGVGFILAGTENDFISNDGPLDWMQQQLPEIGHLSLREITLPRSHNTGQWKNTKNVGLGSFRNTQAHQLELYHQLGNGGVRVLDIRAVKKHGEFYQCHGSFVKKSFHGMLGATLKEMVDEQNRFMKDYPGELFIWQISSEGSWDGDHGYEALGDEARKQLYEELKHLNSRAFLFEEEDVTKWPLQKLIHKDLAKRGQSLVIIQVPSEWASKKHFPGSNSGFVTGLNFPMKTHWSNTDKATTLFEDQIQNLKENRRHPKAEMYNVDWVLTQKDLGAVFPGSLGSIIEMSGEAWKTMYEKLWGALTDVTYPNMITLDNIHGNQHKTMAMAINKCLAVKKCGKLGGMVTGTVNDTIGTVHDIDSGGD